MAYGARVIVREKDIDVVSAQDPFEEGLAALIARIGTRAKLHIQIHTDFLSPYFARESFLNRVRILIAAVTLRTADGIRVVSERIKRSMHARYGRAIPAPSVIPVALPAADVEASPLPANRFLFSFIAVSRLVSEKCLTDVLSALVLVRRRYENVGLFIAGSGPLLRALTRRAEALGLADNVVFLGNRPDVRGLMKSAQGFVQASAHEGYALTLLEAALSGTPIVTTDVGIAGDVLCPETGALVSGVHDIDALAAHMLRLIDNAPLRETLAKNARQAALAHRQENAGQPERIVRNLEHIL
jgi:glycosyltransferase involved in cell wall biosynthesis